MVAIERDNPRLKGILPKVFRWAGRRSTSTAWVAERPALTSLLGKPSEEVLTQFIKSIPAAVGDPLAAFRLTLQGGDPETGRAVFTGHAQGQCIRCHKIRGEGGAAGPDLTDVVKRNREVAGGLREHLLQSLIDPNAKITPGFGSITLILESGRIVAGTLKAEDAQQVTVETPDGKSVSVRLKEIDERTPPKSAMPPLGKVLTPRELRDVLEFLATLSP